MPVDVHFPGSHGAPTAQPAAQLEMAGGSAWGDVLAIGTEAFFPLKCFSYFIISIAFVCA